MSLKFVCFFIFFCSIIQKLNFSVFGICCSFDLCTQLHLSYLTKNTCLFILNVLKFLLFIILSDKGTINLLSDCLFILALYHGNERSNKKSNIYEIKMAMLVEIIWTHIFWKNLSSFTF